MFIFLLLFFCNSAPNPLSAEQEKSTQAVESQKKNENPLQGFSQTERRRLEAIVNQSFTEVHNGLSSDEVILEPKLNKTFIDACRKRGAKGSDFAINWCLMNLRKAGKLKSKATKRSRFQGSKYSFAAEIAARTIHDKYGASTDRIMANPELREEFLEIANGISPKATAYELGKSAFRLRKTRKLKPELVVRVADWKIEIKRHKANELEKNLKLVPTNPGIYIFTDSTGYLYVGEAKNLRDRLTQHLDQSDRESLANYMKKEKLEDIHIEVHSFDPKSKGGEISARRAYESELIRSRKPKFNIRP